ncbi:SH3 domain-containing protein [Streptomyces sp. NPDC058657]|uniref:SH3 domain-containing protein n=1 Tax=unclassified Streptomyces TaxID=2593676 RepID=UPI00366719A3
MLTLKKTALYIAAGALTATLATTPAFAESDPDSGPGSGAGFATGTASASEADSVDTATAAHPRYTQGRVTAKSGLRLRDKPTRSSRIIRTEPYGATVHIFCKTTGDHVGNNNHWYLLTDGTWAWGSAQYIVPKRGHNPRWC